MEHPHFDHWVVPGIRASVVCDGCLRHFEVWKGELWYQAKKTNNFVMINQIN